MSGISSKALNFGDPKNKFGYNGGNELQNKEFSDGSGLELYDAVNRLYDPQLGRFGQVDELSDMALSGSPYAFASNNPFNHNDPLGLEDSKDTLVQVGTTNQGEGVYTNPNDALSNVKVTAYGKSAFQTLYWQMRNFGIDFNRVVNNSLRERLLNYDGLQRWLEKLHSEQREEEEQWLEYGSLLIPGGEIGELATVGKLGKVAFKLFAIKRGKAVLISAAADLTVQMIQHKGDITKINPVSTVSSALLEHPVVGSIAGGFVNASYSRIRGNSIFNSPSDVNVYKAILLNSLGNKVGGELGEGLSTGSTLPAPQYIGETLGGSGAAIIDEITPLNEKK